MADKTNQEGMEVVMWPRIHRAPIPDNKEHTPGCAVLIFSSDRGFVEHYFNMFNSLGLRPVPATTPEAAVAILRMLVVALIVVDEGRGKVESCQILQRARDIQFHAPVLVVSRRPDADFRQEVLTLGAADYLDHPAHSEDVIRALLPSYPGARQHISSQRSVLKASPQTEVK